MKGLYALGEERGAELGDRLARCPDVKAAQDAAAQWMDEIAAAYAAQAPDAARRKKAAGLIRVGKAALEVMGAVNRAEVTRISGPVSGGAQKNWRGLLRCAPTLLGAVAALWAFLTDQTNLCLVSAAAAVGAALIARPGYRPDGVRAEAEPRADAAQMARRIGYLLREIDDVLEEDGDAGAPSPKLTAPVLEAAQMLLEAQITGDAQFALKGVSPLTDALARQGIDFIPYMPERAQDFDLLPAPVGGETIRPAVRWGEELLLRGQATVKR